VSVYRPCRPLALAFEAINEANLHACYRFLRCLYYLCYLRRMIRREKKTCGKALDLMHSKDWMSLVLYDAGAWFALCWIICKDELLDFEILKYKCNDLLIWHSNFTFLFFWRLMYFNKVITSCMHHKAHFSHDWFDLHHNYLCVL